MMLLTLFLNKVIGSISESVRPVTPDGEETPEPHFPEPQIANIRDVGNVKTIFFVDFY